MLNYTGRFENFVGYFGKRQRGRESCLKCLKTFLMDLLYYDTYFLNYVKASVKAKK
jgi:hypothetical protein